MPNALFKFKMPTPVAPPPSRDPDPLEFSSSSSSSTSIHLEHLQCPLSAIYPGLNPPAPQRFQRLNPPILSLPYIVTYTLQRRLAALAVMQWLNGSLRR